MKQSKLLLGALAISTLVVGCPTTTPTPDGGTDAGMPRDGGPDTGRDTGGSTADTGVDTGVPPTDGGTDANAMTDVGVPVTCDGYCTQITTACSAHAQYTDMAACMTACTNAGWTMGTQSDTTGNTLGCRVYHAIAAVGNAALHCPHAGFLGGGVCTPFRTDAPTEGTPTTTEGAYVRVDRMGMPAVATALIGPGTMPATGIPALKDAYNDSNPTGDAAFASGVPLLTAIGAFHALLDDDLIAAHLTPCSVSRSFPVPGAPAPVPACGVQDYTGLPLSPANTHTVASLILPDTLRIDPTAPAGFPNGRQLTDDVIDPILSVLLLNLSPCAGAPTGTLCSTHTGAGAMAACTADTNCTWTGTACAPAATSRLGQCLALGTAGCSADPRCTVSGGACVTNPCEGFPAAACPAQTGCSLSTCGTGTPAPACSVATIGGLPLNPHANDVAYPTPNNFPYFLPPH